MTPTENNRTYFQQYFYLKRKDVEINDIKINLTNIINNFDKKNYKLNNEKNFYIKTINIINSLQKEIKSLKEEIISLKEEKISLKEAKIKQYEDKNQCCICLSNKCNMAFVSCGHACICEECSVVLQSQVNNDIIECPLCRKNGPIIKIYLN